MNKEKLHKSLKEHDELQRRIGNYENAILKCVYEVGKLYSDLTEDEVYRLIFTFDSNNKPQVNPEYEKMFFSYLNQDFTVNYNNAKVSFKTDQGADLPMYATKGSSGMDLKAYKIKSEFLSDMVSFQEGLITVIKPNERLLVGTGLYIDKMDSNYELQIRSRSGLALKYGLIVLNSPGTIDSDYKGEIGVILYNSSNVEVGIQKGDKIAQMVLCKIEKEESLILNNERNGGFGSTGK